MSYELSRDGVAFTVQVTFDALTQMMSAGVRAVEPQPDGTVKTDADLGALMRIVFRDCIQSARDGEGRTVDAQAWATAHGAEALALTMEIFQRTMEGEDPNADAPSQ